MGRILLAWELGSDLGHLGRMRCIAEAALDRGHTVDFVVRDLSRVDKVLGPFSGTVAQAPLWLPVRSKSARAPTTYAEILQHAGYLDEGGLTGMVRGWRALFQALSPDLILAEHAPTAHLAAVTAGVPSANIGTGFFSPPVVSPLPSLRPWEAIPEQARRQEERRVVDVINAVLARWRMPPIESVAGLFERVVEDFLCTWPELDHYPERKGATYWGPVYRAVGSREPRWPDSPAAPRVFAYLKPRTQGFKAAVAALQMAHCTAAVYAPGADRALVRRMRDAGMEVSTEPYAIGAAVGGSEVTVCHAGHDTLAAALAAGRPVLLLPTQLEQYHLARRVEASGAGLMATDKASAGVVAERLGRLLGEPAFREAASGFAERYGGERMGMRVARLIGACEAFLPGGGGCPPD